MPLDAYHFNLWWIALLREREMQTPEGLKAIKLRVAANILIAEEEARERAQKKKKRRAKGGGDSAGDTEESAAVAAVAPADAGGGIDWTDTAAVLALLPPDDPRAVYLRSGGRLDRTGNPVTRGSPPASAPAPTAASTDIAVDPDLSEQLRALEELSRQVPSVSGSGSGSAPSSPLPSSSSSLSAFSPSLPADVRKAMADLERGNWPA